MDFKGKLKRIDHVIEVDMGDIWRVWFEDGDPVINCDCTTVDIKVIEK